jgi:hypothetical protein
MPATHRISLGCFDTMGTLGILGRFTEQGRVVGTKYREGSCSGDCLLLLLLLLNAQRRYAPACQLNVGVRTALARSLLLLLLLCCCSTPKEGEHPPVSCRLDSAPPCTAACSHRCRCCC